MEFEQLAKKVQWLDDERRKDKNYIAHLEERILSLEGKLTVSGKKNLELDSELTRLKTLVNRMDKFDEALGINRAEFHKAISEQEKIASHRDDEIKSVLRALNLI